MMNRQLRLGIITPYWLPKFGGAEQYTYRLVKNLAQSGLYVSIFAGTQKDPNQDNGEIDVTRYTPRGNVEMGEWRQFHHSKTQAEASKALSNIFTLYDFMSRSLSWVKSQSLDMVIVNHPLTLISSYHVRELTLQLKALGVRVGVIHHDNYFSTEKTLINNYVANPTWGEIGWEAAANNTQLTVLSMFMENTKLQNYYRIGSPLFFEPDFIISNSFWSNRFIDPLEEAKKIVVHPVVDEDYWLGSPSNSNTLKMVDIMMVNPQDRKGPEIMANLIRNAKRDWTFRLLKGGWGNSLKSFVPMISDSEAYKEGRVDVCSYVKDMRHAYDSCRLVFFPSLYEGYGLTAVEPMYRRVPVVTSSYPAILEATGGANPNLCAYKDPKFKWVDLITEVLEQRDHWISEAQKRTQELEKRHKEEIDKLKHFLQDICLHKQN